MVELLRPRLHGGRRVRGREDLKRDGARVGLIEALARKTGSWLELCPNFICFMTCERSDTGRKLRYVVAMSDRLSTTASPQR